MNQWHFDFYSTKQIILLSLPFQIANIPFYGNIKTSSYPRNKTLTVLTRTETSHNIYINRVPWPDTHTDSVSKEPCKVYLLLPISKEYRCAHKYLLHWKDTKMSKIPNKLIPRTRYRAVAAAHSIMHSRNMTKKGCSKPWLVLSLRNLIFLTCLIPQSIP